MGRHQSILFLGLSALILAPVAETQGGWKRDPNRPRHCKDGKPTHVKLPSEIFEEKGLSFDNPCPNLDNSQVPNLSCKEIVDNLESTVKDYMQEAGKYCDLRADAKNECGSRGNKDCWQQHRALLKDARGKVNKELEKLRQAQSLIQDLKGILADEVIQPATAVLNGAKDPNIDRQVTAAQQANASSGQTVLHGANHYRGMDPQRIMELAQKVREGGVTESDISGTGAMAREPAQVAMAMQAAASAAGALAGSPGSSGPSSSSYVASNGQTYDPGSGPSLAGPSAPGAPGSAPVTIDIADASKKNGDAEGDRFNSSAASSGSERLRAALKERLARSLASKGGGGENTEASYGGPAVIGGAAGEDEGASGNSVKVSPERMREIMGSGRSRMGGSGYLDGGFAISGSETDAYVQSMIASMSPEEDHGLGSSGEIDGAPEILGADTASLFTRTRETYRRTVKKGLVTYVTSI